MEMINELENIKKSVLVFDLETSAFYPDGTPIDIFSQFDDYLLYAKAKWFGCYSYKYDKYISDQVKGNEETIKNFIKEHEVLVGFNNEEFDTPILKNNDLIDKRYLEVDCMQVLGDNKFAGHKNRGGLMGLKAKSNSLKNWAKAMALETQKGDIDYTIFEKDEWTPEEKEKITLYLEADVKATKQMFDKLWDFWMPFTKFLDEKNILNLSWIRSSIASLTYKAACNAIGAEETYADRTDKPKEEMGGRVIEPKYEESEGVWYVDFASLYPHIFSMFNLFAEKTEEDLKKYVRYSSDIPVGDIDLSTVKYEGVKLWHGNDLFKVKGYYAISEHHPLSKDVGKKLKLRFKLKAEDPTHPLIYALKIFLNSLYGAARSEIFEQIHTENCGWDCCWLGQQINQYTEKRMKDFGFETIAGDTDSIFVKLVGGLPMYAITGSKNDEKDYVKYCLKTIVDEIKANVPFPVDTFKIDLEKPEALPYIMWPFAEQSIEFTEDFDEFYNLLKDNGFVYDEIVEIFEFNMSQILNEKKIKNTKNLNNKLIKVRKGKKKNYCYLYKKEDELKVKYMGLPIIKDNATKLGMLMLKEFLTPVILEQKRAKFSRPFIEDKLKEYLSTQKGLELMAVKWKVKPVDSYKKESQIQAQISAGYFEGLGGTINLIKNKRVGKAGKTSLYCTVEEAIENKLELKDIDLEKINNELEPFIKEDVK